MTDAAIRCTTHHAACDCREAATRAALAVADALASAVEDVPTCPDHATPLSWCQACSAHVAAEADVGRALIAYRAARSR